MKSASDKSPVMRPADVQRFFNISLNTRWRWEVEGKLPKRDVIISGRPFGWLRSTIETAIRPSAVE
jgi:predicted DNA-binding transcriptional regulator AlpA